MNASCLQVNLDAYYSSPVAVQAVDTYHSSDNPKVTTIPRKCVLPLPRTHSEGNEWLFRCRKGFRVYAMYPGSSKFFAGTVVDSTNYCLGEDNICVVEFDGDKGGETLTMYSILLLNFNRYNHLTLISGIENTDKVAQRHIPARFVSLIPREFPGSKQQRGRRSSNTLSKGNFENKPAVKTAVKPAVKATSIFEVNPPGEVTPEPLNLRTSRSGPLKEPPKTEELKKTNSFDLLDVFGSFDDLPGLDLK